MTTVSSSQEQTVSGKPAFWPLAASRSPHLRLTLSPECRGLTDTEREQVFELAFGEGVSPAEYEAFFSGPDLSRPKSPKGLGAATGSALGPYGAIAGAVAGGVGQLLGLLQDLRVLCWAPRPRWRKAATARLRRVTPVGCPCPPPTCLTCSPACLTASCPAPARAAAPGLATRYRVESSS